MLFVVDDSRQICPALICQQEKPKQKQTEKQPAQKMKTLVETLICCAIGLIFAALFAL